VPGPVWNIDSAADSARIGANVRQVMAAIIAAADSRLAPDLDDAREWHRNLYAGCAVPIAGYLGHFRGEVEVAELIGYEVGIGPRRGKWPERVGVWSRDLARELPVFIARVHSGLAPLDKAFVPGERPSSPGGLQAIIGLCAAVHGEWVRLHPFANGNGRTARVWANFVAVRYGLPPFVSVKPRPADVRYARAAQESMGRPPDFAGDHSATAFVFARMLRDVLPSGTQQ
jgi:hypothetical protein